jgi:hypothetical protein
LVYCFLQDFTCLSKCAAILFQRSRFLPSICRHRGNACHTRRSNSQGLIARAGKFAEVVSQQTPRHRAVHNSSGAGYMREAGRQQHEEGQAGRKQGAAGQEPAGSRQAQAQLTVLRVSSLSTSFTSSCCCFFVHESVGVAAATGAAATGAAAGLAFCPDDGGAAAGAAASFLAFLGGFSPSAGHRGRRGSKSWQ